jgi:hypothetical protein
MLIQARLRSALSRAGSCVAGSLLAICVLAGCSSAGFATGGPLSDDGSPGVECSPVPVGGVLSDGLEALTNTGHSVAVVSKVSLADGHRLRILAAYFVPITGHDLYGVRAGFPPPRHLDPGVLWSKRQRADGARIPHTSGEHVTNLVVVVKPATSGGRAAGIDVYYTASGNEYLLQTATGLHVVVGRPCAP